MSAINGLPKWARGTRAWLGFAAAIFAVYVGAAAVGMDLPRPAWISEHNRDIRLLMAGGRDTRQRVLALELEQRRTRYYRVRADAKSQLTKTGRVDPELLREEAFLRGLIDNLEAEIGKIRKRARR